MKTKTLVILVCVAAVLIATAVKTSNKQQARQQANSTSQQVFADLPVNDITRILITTVGGQLELRREDKGWTAPGKFNYAADFDRIKSALITLSDMKGGEERNLDDKQLAKVRLVSPLNVKADNASKGSLAQVFTTSEKPVASILIGTDRIRQSSDSNPMPDGTFISPDEGKTALVVSSYLDAFTGIDAMSWLDTELLNIDSFSITNITIGLYDEKPIVLYTEDGRTMKIDKLSRKEKVDEAKARSVRYAINSLRFDDIASPALDDKAMGFDKASTFRAVTDKDEIYTLTLGGLAPNSENRYLRISAEFVGTIPEVKEPKEGEANLDGIRKQLEEAKKSVNAANERLKSWTYLVSPPKFGVMLYTRKDLVADKDEE